MWLLHDEQEPAHSPRGWREKIELYKILNRELATRCRRAAADEAAIDAARVLRLPGSIHSGTGRRVTYVPQLDEHGMPYFYSLRQMAAFLEVDAPERAFRQPAKALEGKRKNPKCGRGPAAYNARLAIEFLRLERNAGGWPQGVRRRRLSLFAEIMRNAGRSRVEIEFAVRQMADRCRPPFPGEDDAQLEEIVRAVLEQPEADRRHLRAAVLAEGLKVDAETARRLRLTKILPPELKIERDAKLAAARLEANGARLEKQAAKKQAILAALQEIVNHHGKAGRSCRDFEEILKRNYGIKSNHQSINVLLRQVLPGGSQGKPGRPKKTGVRE